MIINYSIKLPGTVSSLIATLGNRRYVRDRVVHEAGKLVRSHLEKAADSRHATATRMGAAQTGFLVAAAKRTEWKRNIITIPAPGMRRAYGPLVIRPDAKPFLTIPKDKISYGKRASDLRREGWFIFRPGRAKILLARKGKQSILAYTLAEKATLKHDPGLLPTDAAIEQAMCNGIAYLLRRMS